MPNISLGVSLSREELALGYLDINDHLNYAIAPGSFGGTVTWNRVTTSSIFMDDEIVVFRNRPKVNEALIIEVYGQSTAEVQNNVDKLVQAACQSKYDLVVLVDGVGHTYACSSADYGMKWETSRLIAKQAQVTLSIPRSPVPKVGVL